MVECNVCEVTRTETSFKNAAEQNIVGQISVNALDN